jgi:hypothetical protein
METKLREVMQSAIQRGDANYAGRLLESAGDLDIEVTMRAYWLPLAEELGRDGSTLNDLGFLGPLLRQKIRNVLLMEADIPVVYWLVPAKRTHLTAAHLVALVLTRRGIGARVWQWPMPILGAFLTVGDGEGKSSGKGCIPIYGETLGWPSLAALVA